MVDETQIPRTRCDMRSVSVLKVYCISSWWETLIEGVYWFGRRPMRSCENEIGIVCSI
jgi:hypothetical protein